MNNLFNIIYFCMGIFATFILLGLFSNIAYRGLTNGWLGFGYMSKENYNGSRVNRLFIRIFDILFSSYLLLSLSPFLAIIVIVTLIDLRGPIFYVARATTVFGNDILVWKFTTFKVTKNKILKVTKWGNFLRKTNLESLPMIFTVLKGDLSVVGLTRVSTERKNIDIIKSRNTNKNTKGIKPGIISPSILAMSKSPNVSLVRISRIDSIYIKKKNILWDFSLILSTVFIMVAGTTFIAEKDLQNFDESVNDLDLDDKFHNKSILRQLQQ